MSSGGKFLIKEDGLAITTPLSKAGPYNAAGRLLAVNEFGECDNCCENICDLYFCGCGLSEVGIVPFIGGKADNQTKPHILKRPDVFLRGGTCDRAHAFAHAREDNTGNEFKDVVTQFKFNCDGDGTGTMLATNYMYQSNRPEEDYYTDRAKRTKFRLNKYSEHRSNGSSGNDSWPLLDVLPTFDLETRRLSVQVKWARVMNGNQLTMDIFTSDMISNDLYDFVSWDIQGTVVESSGYDQIVITDLPAGIITGTAVWQYRGSDENLDRINVSVVDSGSQCRLKTEIVKDYYHVSLGADTALMNFPDRVEKCGLCEEDMEVEIEFDTGFAVFPVMLYADMGNQETHNPWDGQGSGGIRKHLYEYWCGCGSEPYNHITPSSWSPSEYSGDAWYGQWYPGAKKATWWNAGVLNGPYYPLTSHPANKFGWKFSQNEITRILKQEQVCLRPNAAEEYKDCFFQEVGWGDVSGDSLLEDLLDGVDSGGFAQGNGATVGDTVMPLIGHDQPHNDPYIGPPPFGGNNYNMRTNHRLGVRQSLAAPDPVSFNSYEPFSYKNSRKIEFEFDLKLFFRDIRYWGISVFRYHKDQDEDWWDQYYQSAANVGVGFLNTARTMPYIPYCGIHAGIEYEGSELKRMYQYPFFGPLKNGQDYDTNQKPLEKEPGEPYHFKFTATWNGNSLQSRQVLEVDGTQFSIWQNTSDQGG